MAVVLLAGLAAGCGRLKGHADAGADVRSTDGPAAADDASTDSDANRDWIASQCARAAGAPLQVTSIDEMRAALRGRWGLCDPPGLFDRPWPGFQVADTGDHWNFLTWSDGHGLAPEYGLDVEGPITYAQAAAGGPVTVGVQLLPSGEIAAGTPTIGDDPRILTLPRADGTALRYVALPRGTYELPPDAAVDAPEVDAADASVDARDAAPSDGAVPCIGHQDCPVGYLCYVEAPIDSCPTTPVGKCARILSQNCLVGLYPCGCFAEARSCAQFPSGTCHELSNCFGCATSPPDAG